MKAKSAIYLLVLVSGLAFHQAYSQSYTPISGVINEYTSVSAILSTDDNNVDSVVVASTAAFQADDTVMLYCVKGATVAVGASPPPYPGWDAQLPYNAGRYALLIVLEVINPGNTIVFTTNVRSGDIGSDIMTMRDGDMAQLIRVPSYRNAEVTSGGVTANSWNPYTGTGGVVAMFVHGTLRMNGDIDVSGDGFRGAHGSTDTNYGGDCSSVDTMLYYENFYDYTEVRAGLKGEGSTDTVFHELDGIRGKASSINGGGGGNGLFAGGGGGSNHTAGVRGGSESATCGPGVTLTGGSGGFDLGRYYYENGSGGEATRIFFGGGGGSSTQMPAFTTTDGGDGGGIVIIVADTIEGNGNSIVADGGSVSGTATGGAGGGGGGGCIILEVNEYRTILFLSAIGGNGGDTQGDNAVGMGGAGGGGVYWHAGSSLPFFVSPSYLTGSNGEQTATTPVVLPGVPNPPIRESGLEAPLRGFLFNPVPTSYTVCSDVDPEPIVTSDPKGGDGNYTFQWMDSTKTRGTWENITGAESRDYNPGYLTDTTYFRRIVNSIGLADTSYSIVINVHPAITDNTIAAEDTVCSGNAPELFEPSAVIGGGPTGGTFTYQWQAMPEGGSFADIPDNSDESTYQSPGLTETTTFRRIAYAGACVNNSNEEDVVVLETLSGNDITPFDTICINSIPDQISGPQPSNGDQGDIRYQWLISTSSSAMGSTVPGETEISYQSPALDQTTYIRRVVLSGEGDACKDTSDYVEILNIPDITNNTITASQTVCQEDQSDLLTATQPGGGYASEYVYTWISSTDQTSWVPATGGGANDVPSNFDPGVMDGDTTWYRRVVESGGLELVCKDSSDFIVINVLPSISNNVLTPADDELCQWDMPEVINGSLPGGGATEGGSDPTRTYSWEVAQGASQPGSWTHPGTGATAQDYTDPDQLATDVDRWYRRIVTSGPDGQCISISDTVRLVVHSEITVNSIDATEAICFNDTRALRHLSLTGGETGITPIYTWRSWMEGESSADAIPIAASDQQAFMSGPYTDPAHLVYNYDRIVQIGACLDTSNAMQVTVMQLPGGELTDDGFHACEKDTVLQLDLNMDALSPGHYFTPWYINLKDGINTGIGPGILDMDQDTMGIVLDTDLADQVTLNYEIESIVYYPEGDDYGCVSSAADLTGDPVVVQLFRRPDPQILVDGAARDSFKVCNTTATLQLNPDNGTLIPGSEPSGTVFFSPGASANEYNVSIPNSHDDFGKYTIFIRSEAGDCAGYDSIDLHYFEQPAPAYAGADTVLFLINSIQLQADPPTAGIGTWNWDKSTSITVEDIHSPTTMAHNLELGDKNEFTWTIINGEDEGICIETADFSVVTREEVKRYRGFSPNGDLDNEYFIMQGLVYADEFTVTFFNSLGNMVREMTQDNLDELRVDPGLILDQREDELIVWDGYANNGNPVPSGTYYYVVHYIKDGVDYPYNDYVVVQRD